MNISDVARITKDLELKHTQDNKPLLRFSVAQNDYKKEGHFFNCVAFGKTAELIANYCHKGDMIYIQGELWNNNYEKEDGTKVYQDVITVNSIKFIEPKKQEKPTFNNQLHNEIEKKQDRLDDITEDSLPF